MIIPDNVTPSWTNADVADSSIYAMHRNRLWLLNYCASLWPQVFSWVVVNIHPASPTLDFRFEAKFASRAILVTAEWTGDGKGCSNSSCYATYPEKLLCTAKDTPIIFPSGDRTDVVACQPACFAKRREQTLRKTASKMQSLTDQTNPGQTCPSCALDRNLLYRTRTWRFGQPASSRINVYDQDGRFVGVEDAVVGRTRATADENNQAQIDVDMPHLHWDPKYRNCIVANDYIYRTVVEPAWRDTSPNCKLTNFEIGDDVFWGIRFNERDPAHRPNYGFLVGHSTSYCRAFAKNRDDANGSCYQPWWQKALAYTIAGDGIIHAIHAALHPNQCSKNWNVESGDRAQVQLSLSSETNYSRWRTDINAKFVLPPPNVTLEDLGIDVLRTGNRLYWNNVEGVISQLALFETVDTLVTAATGSADRVDDDADDDDDASSCPDWDQSLYRDYNFKSNYNNSENNVNGGSSNSSISSDARLTPAESQALLREYRDLLREKTVRLRDRLGSTSDASASAAACRSVDALRDNDLDGRIEALWRRLRANLTASSGDEWRDVSYNVPSGSSSIVYTLNANEYAAQTFVRQKIPDDAKSPTRFSSGGVAGGGQASSSSSSSNNSNASSPASYVDSLNKRRESAESAAAARNVGPVDGRDDEQTIESILEHINDEVNRDQLLEMLTIMGLSLGFDLVAMNVIKKLLRTVHSSMLQIISRYGAGKVSLALAKIGVRMATSRMVGAVAARLSLKMMVMIGQAATVVGLVIDAISLVSLIFDIAELAGWDPGHFLNETDLAFYHDMAKYFSESLDSTATGPVTPLEMTQLYYSSVDKDPNKSSDESAEETRSNVPVDNAPLSDVSESDQTLHVDERLDQPKWYNKSFAKCFRRSLTPTNGDKGSAAASGYDQTHLPILNSLTSWNIVCSLDFVGNLTTNSFGQRIFPDAGGSISLQDDDIAALVTESSYRQLYTSTSAVNFDHRRYNYRNRVAASAAGIVGTVGFAAAAAAVTFLTIRTLGAARRSREILPFWLVAAVLVLTALLALLYACLTYVPLRTRLINDDDDGDDGVRADDDAATGEQTSPDEKWQVSYYVNLLRRAVVR